MMQTIQFINAISTTSRKLNICVYGKYVKKITQNQH